MTNAIIVFTVAMLAAIGSLLLAIFNVVEFPVAILAGAAVFLGITQIHAAILRKREKRHTRSEIARLKQTNKEFRVALQETHGKIDQVKASVEAKATAQSKKIISELQVLESLMRDFAGKIANTARVAAPADHMIERGLHQPSVRVLKAISDALNLSAETLLAQAGLIDAMAGGKAAERAEAAGQAALPGTEQAIRADKRLSETEWRPENLQLAQEIKRHAEARGLTTGQFAVAWVLASKFVTAAIAGPRTLEQWEDYVPALDYRWTAEDEALVDRFVVTGHSSTPGYNDPGHPYLGRVLREGA